jgi:hypothetical protein
VLAANLAADLDTWTRLLGLHDDAELARRVLPSVAGK